MLGTVPRSIPGSRRRLAVVAVTFLFLLGCSSSDDDDTATATDAPTPRGVVAIGHSGLTGASSDPDRPGEDALENSWATGTSPAVDSVYRRLVAASPEHEGHVANHGIDGARAAELPAQAEAAAAR